MGFLRFILAAAVVAEHSTPIFGVSLTGGHLAVRLFFMVSGFYMALILSTKYSSGPNRFWLFISNRLLRIYPLYFVILGLSLAFYAAASIYLGKPADRLVLWQDALATGQNKLWLALIALSQITVVGMETVCLFLYSTAKGFFLPGIADSAADAAFIPTATAPNATGLAWRFLFVPQAWSIGLELMFYFIAPWLVLRRTRTLILISLVSVGLNLAFAFGVNPNLSHLLNYFFFPAQLYFFVLGIFAYRFSKPILAALKQNAQTTIIALTFAVIFHWQWLPVPVPVRNVLCICLVFLAIPILFARTKNSMVNRHIGDLSYPIYISHILVKWGLLALMGVSAKGASTPPGWLLLICSTIFAAILLWGIDRKIDRLRQKRVEKLVQPAKENSATETPRHGVSI